MIHKINSNYLNHLQWVYHPINSRGICISRSLMKEAVKFVDSEILRNLEIASQQWNCKVFIGAANAPDEGIDCVNINSYQGDKALLKKMQDLGYIVPKLTKRSVEGEYESHFSTGELSLQKMLVTDQFNFRSTKGGDPAIKAILAVRELGKLRSSYFNARYVTDAERNTLYLTSYNVAGTLPGRRSSKKHAFGYGNNAQNFPKHGKLANVFRRCLIARPGNILVNVDLKSADEWSVNALAEDLEALKELDSGIDRHTNFAAFIFSLPLTYMTMAEWHKSIQRYIGKKTRHGNNYGMGGQRMSDALAQESYSITKIACDALLAKADLAAPRVRAVFHTYIRTQINKNRILQTPFGRERQFLGMRPNDANNKILNEAYAYIPASVTADLNGFALYSMETESQLPVLDRYIVNECHDSITFDIPCEPNVIYRLLQDVEKAYDIPVTFHNGITVKVPIEVELGFDFATSKTLKTNSLENIISTIQNLESLREQKIEAVA